MIYYFFITKGNLELTPVTESIIGTFIGIFDTKNMMDTDITEMTGFSILTRAKVQSYISVKTLIITWVSIAICSLGTSMYILKTKDIK